MNFLAKLDAATRALKECSTAREVKRILDIASAAKDYARRQKLGRDAIAYATRIEAQATRILGAMLKKGPKNVGAKGLPGKGRNRGDARVPRFDAPPTLASIGLTKKESARAQKVAALDDATFAGVEAGTITIPQAFRKVKETKREKKRSESADRIAQVPDISTAEGCFSTIVVDPPWDWGDEGDADQLGRARPTYATLPQSKLLELPIQKLAAVDAHLYLWITNRSLPKGFGLLEAWGFRYVTCLTWCKPSFGMGNYFRGQTEQILFGVRGSLSLNRKDVGTWFTWARGRDGHSSKPAESYGLIESCSPGPYLQIFPGPERDGWASLGVAL